MCVWRCVCVNVRIIDCVFQAVDIVCVIRCVWVYVLLICVAACVDAFSGRCVCV